jgi:hypothetical protein
MEFSPALLIPSLSSLTIQVQTQMLSLLHNLRVEFSSALRQYIVLL